MTAGLQALLCAALASLVGSVDDPFGDEGNWKDSVAKVMLPNPPEGYTLDVLCR